MAFRISLLLVSLLVCSVRCFLIGVSVKACRINDTKNSTGICKPLMDCPAVIGLLRAGIKPTPCPLQGPGTICCPDRKRISSEKCDEFKRILTKPLKSKQALDYDGHHLEQKYDNTIKCESYVHSFISGGTNARLHEYPHQVALGYGETPAWRCGGTVIDPRFVLTAGHCVRTVYGPPTVVLLGDRKLSTKHDPSRVLVKISDIFVHPRYKPPLQYNDIAIIQLQQAIVLSRAILPACLPNPSDRLDRTTGVEATGWGRTGAFDRQSDTLKSATLAKFDTTECAAYFESDNANKARLPNGIIQSQFCAGDKHGYRDTCQGDSGGPITVEDKTYSCVRYLVGITSFGSSMCGYQQPGVYTNILSYLDWIEDFVWQTAKVSANLLGNNSLNSDSDSKVDSNGLIFSPLNPENNHTSDTAAFLAERTGPYVQNINPFNSSPSLTTTTTQLPITNPLNTIVSSETTTPPHLQFIHQKYNFNISGTIADLLNKLSIGR